MNTFADQQRQSPATRSPDSSSHTYLTVPTRLLDDLADNPLAIGLYSLVARLSLIEHAPIPLSAADVQRYDPAPSRGAVLRALARLVGGGWLIEHTRPGYKTSYAPGWGMVCGAARPWQRGAPLLGRPRRMRVVLLNKRLLDTYMGKLATHRARPAMIERYVTRPLLGLGDVGVYALSLSGRPAETRALLQLGLVRHDQARPLASDAHILALASQGQLEGGEQIALTIKGLRKIGCAPAATEDSVTGDQPLFFVPQHLIGSMIAPVIGSMIGHDGAATGAKAHDYAVNHDDTAAGAITWRDTDQQSISPPNPPQCAPVDGGGNHQAGGMGEGAAPADNEATRLLRAINVRPQVVAELAEQPITVIRAAIADGKARTSVRDLAGWVVAMVRNARDHSWQIPYAPTDVPADACAASDDLTHLCAPDAGCYALAGLDEAAPATQPATALAADDSRDAATLPADLTTQLQRALYARTYPELWPAIAGLTARDAGDTLTLCCDSPAQLPVVRARLLPLIGPALRELGRAPLPHLALTTHGAALVPTSDCAAQRRPSWIVSQRWDALPRMLRAALIDSTLEDGVVCGATPGLTHLLRTRFAVELAALQER